VTDLPLIGQDTTTLGGTYALGKDINAREFSGFSSGTTFTGLLDGNGGLGTISTISNLMLSSKQSSDSVGLFPFVGSSGNIRNLNLASVSISAGADVQFIGAVAGQNEGSISNVTVSSGTVTGGSFNGIGAGGLVGQNKGTISFSTSAATITVGD